jgi:hypothetical protein
MLVFIVASEAAAIPAADPFVQPGPWPDALKSRRFSLFPAGRRLPRRGFGPRIASLKKTKVFFKKNEWF